MQVQSKPRLTLAIYFALGAMVISGVNNFLTKIAVTAIKDPIFYTTLKNAIVAIFLIGIIVLFKRLPEISALTKKQLLKLSVIGFIGGSIPFALYFSGLQMTSAINASLIHKTLFLWVLMLAIPILREKFACQQWLGVGLIFGANILVGGFTGFKYNTGELMILAATIFWAIENIVAKKVLKEVSSLTVAAFRMVIGSAFLAMFLFWRGTSFEIITSLSSVQWGWTLLTSLLLFGYVITWYTALKYAPATFVATILVLATLITNILSAIFITHALTLQQLLSSGLFVAGLLLVIIFAKETSLLFKDRLADRIA